MSRYPLVVLLPLLLFSPEGMPPLFSNTHMQSHTCTHARAHAGPFVEQEEQDRPQFEGEDTPSPITGEIMAYYNPMIKV